MERIKLLLVFGTRPEAIKMAPLVKEFQKKPEIFDTRICVTAQHRQMLDQVLSIFNIETDYDLDLMKPDQDLFDITVGVLTGLKSIIQEFKPAVLLVHGDTGTSTAAGLASFYKLVPVGHIEAGLRTYNKYSPWPEEVNRQLTSRIASLHFAPTPWAAQNLRNELIPEESICITGNTVIDALRMAVSIIETQVGLEKQIIEDLRRDIPALEEMVKTKKIILVTGHRRENFGEGFMQVCAAIKEIAERHPDCAIIYPVHLNPNVQKPVRSILSGLDNVFLIEPLDYLPFIYLMKHCHFVLTDSGGIQEEAPGLGKPVLVMRNTTERPEAVHAGTVKLVGTDKEKIVENAVALLEDTLVYTTMSQAINPYGDGKASERISQFIQQWFEKSSEPGKISQITI